MADQDFTRDAAAMSPPGPLTDEFFKWMAGHWEGKTESPWGSSHDVMKCAFQLDGQFLVIDHRSEMSGGSVYLGRGFLTLDENGGAEGYWFDCMRTRSRGSGRIESNRMIMEWIDTSGKQSRITERVSDDRMKTTIYMSLPDGQEVTVVTEMFRQV